MGTMEFHTRQWPTSDQVRETIDALTQSACPSSEAGIIDFLSIRGIHTDVGSRGGTGDLVSYDFHAPGTHFTGQWHIDGSSIRVIATFGGTRAEIESHLELYRSELVRVLGEPAQEKGMAHAPRLAWHRQKHGITLDAFWSDPQLSVLMLAVELEDTDPSGQ
ncbi:hypothetical protein [Arthrobacter sp. IK3]|uniref:hypothetical protein n=1 Tax=Arthrobacter sp. IK3 TaxID=3448169 RepID=UPI003EE3087E